MLKRYGQIPYRETIFTPCKRSDIFLDVLFDFKRNSMCLFSSLREPATLHDLRRHATLSRTFRGTTYHGQTGSFNSRE